MKFEFIEAHSIPMHTNFEHIASFDLIKNDSYENDPYEVFLIHLWLASTYEGHLLPHKCFENNGCYLHPHPPYEKFYFHKGQ